MLKRHKKLIVKSFTPINHLHSNRSLLTSMRHGEESGTLLILSWTGSHVLAMSGTIASCKFKSASHNHHHRPECFSDVYGLCNAMHVANLYANLINYLITYVEALKEVSQFADKQSVSFTCLIEARNKARRRISWIVCLAMAAIWPRRLSSTWFVPLRLEDHEARSQLAHIRRETSIFSQRRWQSGGGLQRAPLL